MTKKVFIQVQCDEETRQQGHAIAKYRGIKISDVVRLHIKKAYKALPDEAKR